MVLGWVLLPLGAYIAVVTAYMAVVLVGAWAYRAPRGPAAAAPLRIAVIVPAHDEGARLARTLRDLAACDYPAGALSTVVIADNCRDDTAAVARAEGALVFERQDTAARGKGAALDWLLRSQSQLLGGFDVIAFVDADMFVDRGFARALAATFADPRVEVVQSRNTVANGAGSWLAAFGFASFAFVNHVRPAGRCFLGGSAGLKGSGMAFRAPLVLATGWPSHSIAEDQDFARALVLRGLRVHYQPAAVVTSEIAAGVRQVRVQQERWEGGKHQVVRDYLPRVALALLRRPSTLLLDEFLDLLVPPLTVMLLLLAVLGALSLPAGASLPAAIAGAGLLVHGAAVVTGLVQLRAPPRTWAYLALSPLYVVAKLLLLARLALRPARGEWRRTPRDGEVP